MEVRPGFPHRLGPEFPVTYTNFCGDIDLIGDKKAQGRYRDVMWDISPLELLVHEPVPEGKVEKFGMWCWPRELRTPGKPAAVHVVRECGNAGDELVYFKIEVTDSLGTVVPEAFPLSFDIRGAGFMSAGNGGPDDMASFRSRTPSTWRGAALLIVRPDGPDAAVEVSVSSEGLQTGISQ